jgi:DNA-binding NtrC family response regulator
MAASRVLIVDDRALSRAHIALALQARGFATCEAEDGRAGFDTFEREAPDAVVTDVRMPRADGFELLERIRSRSDAPVFCVTAYPEWDVALLAMRKGATYFYRWPGDFDRMIDDVAASLGATPADAPRPPFASLDVLREEGQRETAAQRGEMVAGALRATRGNVAQAAELLRVSRRTLYHWMERYGVRRNQR